MPPVVWFMRRETRKRRNGLSMLQFRALYLIQTRPMVNLSAVAEHVVASLPTASRMVDVLQNKGLVKRCESKDDRRQVELVITPQGEQALDLARKATLAKVRETLATLEDGQLDMISNGMRLLHGVFEAAWLADSSPGVKRANGSTPEGSRATPSV